jgi:hypothetical protein
MHIAVKLIADNWGQNEERWFLGLSPKEMVIEKNIKMEIEYKLNVIPPTEEIIDLYNWSLRHGSMKNSWACADVLPIGFGVVTWPTWQ